jgi:hypothetical protein
MKIDPKRVQEAYKDVVILYSRFDGYEIAEAIKQYRKEQQALEEQAAIKQQIAELERQINP